jgi:hypothetical protein
MEAGKGKFEAYSSAGLAAQAEREVGLASGRSELARLEGLEKEALERKDSLLAQEVRGW